MAEKYGTVPKRFTSAWWGYFWDYYKWQTIGIAFAALLVVVTLVQCATREKYDMTVTYAGGLIFDEENTNVMESIFEENSSDVDENGETNVFFLNCVLSDTPGSEEYTYAMRTKLDLTLQDETAYLFIFDKTELDTMLSREGLADTFVPVSEWVDNPDDACVVNAGGGDYAYSLQNSKLLNDAGIKCSDMYMVIKQCFKDKPNAKAVFESSKELARSLAQ
ncbi:MAG: hypothetical protein PUF72_00530 [Clostridiales bacterium]|nr:hypothetical protein [Clostridiales bacterium]